MKNFILISLLTLSGCGSLCINLPENNQKMETVKNIHEIRNMSENGHDRFLIIKSKGL